MVDLTELCRLMNEDGMEFNFYYAEVEDGESEEVVESNPHYETLVINARVH